MELNLPYQIRKAREKTGLTQVDFAKKLGTHNVYYCMMERGSRPISIKWLERIADASDTDLVIALIPKENV